MCFAQVKSYRAKPKGDKSRKSRTPKELMGIIEKTGIGDSLRRLGELTRTSQSFGLFGELKGGR